MKGKRFAAVCAVMIGLTAALAGCGAKKAEAAEAAPLVKTMTVGAEEQAARRSFSGTVHGYYESNLAFQIGGRITARYVSAGDRVSAGQALFRVDSKDAEEQAAAAQSAVISAEAQLDLASSTRKRYQALHEVDAISDLAMDQTENQYKLAAAQLAQARATLARAENNLSFTVLTADRDGVIGSTLCEVGQVVAAGTPVVLIVDDAKKDVYISLTEKQYRMYSVGMPCTVTFWALPGVSVRGVIREKAASPDAATGTYDVKVTLVDPPEAVTVGMTAEVVMEEPAGQASFTVPLSAMAPQSEEPAVWVVKEGKAALVPVKTGAYGADTVEITAGLSKGDRVITAGTQRLSSGDEVRT